MKGKSSKPSTREKDTKQTTLDSFIQIQKNSPSDLDDDKNDSNMSDDEHEDDISENSDENHKKFHITLVHSSSKSEEKSDENLEGGFLNFPSLSYEIINQVQNRKRLFSIREVEALHSEISAIFEQNKNIIEFINKDLVELDKILASLENLEGNPKPTDEDENLIKKRKADEEKLTIITTKDEGMNLEKEKKQKTPTSENTKMETDEENFDFDKNFPLSPSVMKDKIVLKLQKQQMSKDGVSTTPGSPTSPYPSKLILRVPLAPTNIPTSPRPRGISIAFEEKLPDTTIIIKPKIIDQKPEKIEQKVQEKIEIEKEKQKEVDKPEKMEIEKEKDTEKVEKIEIEKEKDEEILLKEDIQKLGVRTEEKDKEGEETLIADSKHLKLKEKEENTPNMVLNLHPFSSSLSKKRKRSEIELETEKNEEKPEEKKENKEDSFLFPTISDFPEKSSQSKEERLKKTPKTPTTPKIVINLDKKTVFEKEKDKLPQIADSKEKSVQISDSKDKQNSEKNVLVLKKPEIKETKEKEKEKTFEQEKPQAQEKDKTLLQISIFGQNFANASQTSAIAKSILQNYAQTLGQKRKNQKKSKKGVSESTKTSSSVSNLSEKQQKQQTAHWKKKKKELQSKTEPDLNTYWKHVEEYFHNLTEKDTSELLNPDPTPDESLPELGKLTSQVPIEDIMSGGASDDVVMADGSAGSGMGSGMSFPIPGVFDGVSEQFFGSKISNHLVQRLMSSFIEEIPPTLEKADEILFFGTPVTSSVGSGGTSIIPTDLSAATPKRSKKGRPTKQEGDVFFNAYRTKISTVINQHLQNPSQLSNSEGVAAATTMAPNQQKLQIPNLQSSETILRMDSALYSDLKSISVLNGSSDPQKINPATSILQPPMYIPPDRREDDQISSEIRNLLSQLKDAVAASNEKKKNLSEKFKEEKEKETRKRKQLEEDRLFLMKYLLDTEAPGK